MVDLKESDCKVSFLYSDCRSSSAEQLLDFNSQDLAGIQEIQRQEDVFSLLVCSLCPTIYGQDMVKVRFACRLLIELIAVKVFLTNR